MAVFVLSGCSGEQAVPGAPSGAIQATADSSSPAAAQATGSSPMPVPSGAIEFHDGEPVETFTEPAWDESSRAAALAAAVGAMAAFARPEVPYEAWWGGLGPLLSVQAQIDYQYVDPVSVPARAVTGDPVLVDETSTSVAGVEVPTNVGTYTVILRRSDASAAWLVERITPPEGVG